MYFNSDRNGQKVTKKQKLQFSQVVKLDGWTPLAAAAGEHGEEGGEEHRVQPPRHRLGGSRGAGGGGGGGGGKNRAKNTRTIIEI